MTYCDLISTTKRVEKRTRFFCSSNASQKNTQRAAATQACVCVSVTIEKQRACVLCKDHHHSPLPPPLRLSSLNLLSLQHTSSTFRNPTAYILIPTPTQVVLLCCTRSYLSTHYSTPPNSQLRLLTVSATLSRFCNASLPTPRPEGFF